MLAVAGAALDNSLVYGDVFYLNTSLWKMRQIMRNFAFFALVAILLYGIIINIVKAGNAGKRAFKSLIIRLVIASTLIPMSWFLMGVLIDFSTIGIYSLGALPLNIMQDMPDDEANELKHVRYLQPEIRFSADNTNAKDGTDATHSIFYTCNKAGAQDSKKYFIPCRIENGFFVPKGEKSKQKTWEHFKRTQASSRAALGKGETQEQIYNQISDAYCVWGNQIIDMQELLIDNETGAKVDRCSLQNHVHTGREQMAQFECPALYSLIDRSAGMT